MRFFVFLFSLLVIAPVHADSPRRPFPHGQEDKAPEDETPNPTADRKEQRSCTLNFNTWAKRKEAPETHPERAKDYLFSGEVMQKMRSLTQEWPGIIRGECIGRSVRRHPIWSFHIENPTRPTTYTVLVFAQLHALEWLGTEVVVKLAEQLTASAPEGVKVVLVPIVNPDGRDRVERDLLNDRVGIYRRANANGLDLNRDWSVNRDITSFWAKLPFTKRYYYTSHEPLSQPESQALDRLAADIQPDAVVSLHAFGGYVYYPWGGRNDPTEDQREHQRLAEVMIRSQSNGGYITVQLGKWANWFKAHGVEIDHFYGKYGAKSFIIELSHSGINLFDWDTVRDFFRWYNPIDPAPHVDNGYNAVRGLIYDYAYQVRKAGIDTVP